MRMESRNTPGRSIRSRRGSALVAVMVLIFIASMIVAGFVLLTGRDSDLTVRRVETIQAFYAAEAGMNMAIREVANNTDEDGDGAIGTISDDGTDANDPSVSDGQVIVTSTTANGVTTLVSKGRSGESRRQVEADLLPN